MYFEFGHKNVTPPQFHSQENPEEYYGKFLTPDCNSEVKKRIARRMKTSNLRDESELTNLVIEGADSGDSLSDSDKKYIEKFTNLEIFAFNETGLRCAKNLPRLQKLLRIELCYNKID